MVFKISNQQFTTCSVILISKFPIQKSLSLSVGKTQQPNDFCFFLRYLQCQSLAQRKLIITHKSSKSNRYVFLCEISKIILIILLTYIRLLFLLSVFTLLIEAASANTDMKVSFREY